MDNLEKVNWLSRNLFIPGHRACLVRGKAESKKIGTPCTAPIENDIYWRDHLLSHVCGTSLRINTLIKGKPPEAREGIGLGIYFGGSKCPLGPNQTMIWGIDCDADDDKLNEKLRATQDLESFLKCDLSKFAVVFKKKNSVRWHAHGRLEKPVDAIELKEYIKSKLPRGLSLVEVFPKCKDISKPYGNYMRLPFGNTGYEFLNESISDIVPLNWALVPVNLNSLNSKTPIHVFMSTEEGNNDRIKKTEKQKEPTLTLIGEEPDIEAIVKEYHLEMYVAGEYVEGKKNTDSEFDSRFLWQLKCRCGRDPRILRAGIIYRNRTNPARLSEQYINTTINYTLSMKDFKSKYFSSPVVRNGNFTSTWLYTSNIWRHGMAGCKSRDSYFHHWKIACDTTNWDLNSWSPIYSMAISNLISSNCGCFETVRRSDRMLRLMGLLKLTKQGSLGGFKSSRYTLRMPTVEDNDILIEIVNEIKQGKHGSWNILSTPCFRKILTMMKTKYPSWYHSHGIGVSDVG